MNLNVTKGSIARFIQPKVTVYEYEITRHRHDTRYDATTETSMEVALGAKFTAGVHGTPYYYSVSGSGTRYAYCHPINLSTTTQTYTINFADGHQEIVERTYLTNFTGGNSDDTVYFSSPSHVTALLRSYYERPANDNYGMRLTNDKAIWESQTSLNRLHLFYMVENLVLERDQQGGVIGYHFDPEMVEIVDTYSGSHYGTYWYDNQGRTGETIEAEVQLNLSVEGET